MFRSLLLPVNKASYRFILPQRMFPQGFYCSLNEETGGDGCNVDVRFLCCCRSEILNSSLNDIQWNNLPPLHAISNGGVKGNRFLLLSAKLVHDAPLCHAVSFFFFPSPLGKNVDVASSSQIKCCLAAAAVL